MSLQYLMQEKVNLIFVLNINEAKLILYRILRDANIWFLIICTDYSTMNTIYSITGFRENIY
jgi:hypothetical protein